MSWARVEVWVSSSPPRLIRDTIYLSARGSERVTAGKSGGRMEAGNRDWIISGAGAAELLLLAVANE